MKITKAQLRRIILLEMRNIDKNNTKKEINEAEATDYFVDNTVDRLDNIEAFLRSEFDGTALEGRSPDAGNYIRAFEKIGGVAPKP